MPDMPSAEMHHTSNPIKSSDFNITDVEGLVLEIKENLRLSAASNRPFKAMSCSHMSRKTSRSSPYQKPGKINCCGNSISCGGSTTCLKVNKHKSKDDNAPEDPYELLQQLLRDGSLVNEAVRRVKLGLSTKQQFFYDSDEESKTPLLRFYPQDN